MRWKVEVVDWRAPHCRGSFRKCATRRFKNLAHARHWAKKAAQRYAARFYDVEAQQSCAVLGVPVVSQQNFGVTAGHCYQGRAGYRTATITLD